MDENRYYYKHNTYTSNASDDSSCTFPLPWLTDTRRRKSRLGKHGRNNRVLQEINSQNADNIEQIDENKEPHKAPLDKDSISFDYTKPTDTDSDTHDVGFMKSNDALDCSFVKLLATTGGGSDVSFSNVDTADLMDISVSKMDTNNDMDLIDISRFSSPDEIHLQNRNVESNLKTNDHSSFEDDILNMHGKSYSSEFVLNSIQPSSSSTNDVLNPLRTALPIDMVLKTSDYGSLLEDISIEPNQTQLAVDLVLKNCNYSSPKENTPPVNHRTPLPADLVLKTNDYESPQDNVPASAMDEVDSRSKTDYSSSRENISLGLRRSNDFAQKRSEYSSPKENVATDPHLSLFSIDFVSKKNVYSSPIENIINDIHLPSFPIDFAPKKNDYSSPRENVSPDCPPASFPIDFAPKKNDYSSPKDPIVPDTYRSSCSADDFVLKNSQPSPRPNDRIELPQRTPFSSEPLQKANQVSPKRCEIPAPIPELFPKLNQAATAKPAENGAGEFKQPEAIMPQKKDDFKFEAPLPPPNLKSNDKLPAFITVKGKPYNVLNVLGSGGSSLVYQVLHPEHGEMLAIKQVKLSEIDDSIAEGYIDEVKLLKKLQKCGSIITMYDHEIICENGKKLLNVVMEKGDTDLAELLKNVNKYKKPTIYMIVYYWTEMLSAVLEIHNEGIIHSDLKPANFLIVKGSLKLIDFGIASSMQGDMTSVYKDVFTGTLNYMSPEAVQFVHCASGSIGYRITYKTDVWSLGCILYHLIYGRLPFQHLKKKWDKMRAIVDPKIEIEFPEAKGVPTVLMSALKSCLEKDPKKRLSVSQLLQLPYFGN